MFPVYSCDSTFTVRITRNVITIVVLCETYKLLNWLELIFSVLLLVDPNKIL